MIEDKVILVDNNDNQIGLMPKLEAHEKGVLHRAFSVFIFNNHGEADVDVLTSEDAKAVAGNISAYDQMIFYIAQNDISTDSVYQKVCDQIDISSYIDYWINETYCGAKDISVNIRFFEI